MTTSQHSVWGTEVDWASGTLRDRSGARPPAQWMPAPQPGTLPKRPFTFFEAMDGGFRLLRFAPGATFGIAMIVHTLVTLAAGLAFTALVVGNAGFIGRVLENPEAGIGLNIVIQTVSVAASFLILSLVQLLSAFAAVAADSAFSRERTTLSAVWRALRGRRLRLVLLCVVCLAAHVLVLGVLVAPGLIRRRCLRRPASASPHWESPCGSPRRPTSSRSPRSQAPRSPSRTWASSRR